MSLHENTFLPVEDHSNGSMPVRQRMHFIICLPDDHNLFSLAIVLDLLQAANDALFETFFTWETLSPDQALSQSAKSLCDKARDAARAVFLLAQSDGPAPYGETMTRLVRDVWRRGAIVGGWGNGSDAMPHFATKEEPDGRCRQEGFGNGIFTSTGQAVVSDMVLALIEASAGRQAMVDAMEKCLIRRNPLEGKLLPDRVENSLSPIDQRVQLCIRLMRQNIDRSYSIATLSRAAKVSERHVERLFNQKFGLSPARYFEEMRIATALKLMRETDMALEDVAATIGFKKLRSFRQKFKRHLGALPDRH